MRQQVVRAQSWLSHSSRTTCTSDRSQVLGQNGGSDQDWAGSSSLFGYLGEKGSSLSSQQHVRCGGGAGELDQQPLKEKPGLLLLSNSAWDSGTWVGRRQDAAGSLLLGELYLSG